MKSYGTRGQAHVEEAGRGWRVRLTLEGVRHQRRFSTKGEANEAASLANSILPRLRRGLDQVPAGATREEVGDYLFSGGRLTPSPAKPRHEEEVLLKALIESYRLFLKTTHKEISSQKTEEVHLRHLERFLEGEALLRRPVSRLTVGVLRDYRDWRREKVKAKTVNKETATFGLLLDFGKAEPNPVRDLVPLPEDPRPPFRTGVEIERLLLAGVFTEVQKREIRKARVLLLEEIEEILRIAAGSEVHVPLSIAVYTGARRGEIARLTWADVDLERRRLTVHSKKQSRSQTLVARTTAIHSSLLPVLQAHRLRTGGMGYLFPGKEVCTHTPPNSLHLDLASALEGTAYEGVGWHTFRHSFITNMARAGVSRDVIKNMVGHVSDEMFERYRHVLPDEQERALEAMESLRRGLA